MSPFRFTQTKISKKNFSSRSYLIKNFMNSKILQEMIDGELTKTFVKLLDMYGPG